MKKRFFTIAAILIHLWSTAQTGSWNVLNVKGTFSNKWSVFAEGQIRSWKLYDHFFYYEAKTAVNYNFHKNFSLAGGLGTYHTFTNSGNFKQPVVNNEFRTFQQLFISQIFGRLSLDHRYRAEQRWTTTGYRNRSRYRFNTIVPINKKSLTDKTVFINAFDELFFTDSSPYFERNRLYGGLGYKLNSTLTVQAGYLNQFDYNLSREFAKGYCQLNFFYPVTSKR